MLIMKEGEPIRLACEICGSEENVKQEINGDFCSECDRSLVESYEPGWKI